jgi:rhomboid protease GluP
MLSLPTAPATVFRGSKALCREFSLVLEARDIEYEMLQPDAYIESWILTVPSSLALRAHDEFQRYSTERHVARAVPQIIEPFAGAAYGAMGYVFVLLTAAYCAGAGVFGADWLSIGALDASAPSEGWRAVTALTLHLDQEHLLGNLLFGVVAGVAAGRLLGPGIAWLSILGAAALANYVEIIVAPASHQAVGASTAVFAALGLLAGLGWRQRLTLRERRWYRWAPLIAGICLLTLLGAGTAHVDVLGHALGFVSGVVTGWVYARARLPRERSRRLQFVAGIGAMLAIGVAWLLALGHAM